MNYLHPSALRSSRLLLTGVALLALAGVFGYNGFRAHDVQATPLSVALDIQGAGLSLVEDGVGLTTWDRTTPVNLSVTIPGPVQAALLYWAGRDIPCPQSGGVFVVPFQPYKDQVLTFASNTITGTIIGTE